MVGRVVKFMLNGNSDIIADILKTLINGKNVQYVDKVNIFFSCVYLYVIKIIYLEAEGLFPAVRIILNLFPRAGYFFQCC